MKKDIRKLAALARRAGWSVEYTGGGHLRWVPPQGGPVYSASTPSDLRVLANMKARLRRAGLEC